MVHALNTFFYFGNVELSVKFPLSLHAAGALLKKQEAPITLLSNFEKKNVKYRGEIFQIISIKVIFCNWTGIKSLKQKDCLILSRSTSRNLSMHSNKMRRINKIWTFKKDSVLKCCVSPLKFQCTTIVSQPLVVFVGKEYKICHNFLCRDATRWIVELEQFFKTVCTCRSPPYVVLTSQGKITDTLQMIFTEYCEKRQEP